MYSIATRTALFAAAHEDTRAIRIEFPNADYRVTFAAALRARYAAIADSPRAEWESMGKLDQFAALDRMTRWCMNRDKAESDRAGNYRPNHFKFVSCEDDIANIVCDAWTDYMPRALANAEKRDIMPSLRAVMANAVRTAAQHTARIEHRHASALRYEAMTDESGNEYMREYIRTDAAATAEPIAPNPEDALLTLDAIERACADDIDRKIVWYTAQGYTMREIAERIDKSAMYISRHLKAIRERYAAPNIDDCAADIVAYRIRKRIANA